MKLPMFGQDWRMRWLYTRHSSTLHRIYVIDWADSDLIHGDGVSACGRMDYWHMPGIFSRMGSPRCKECCAILGIPAGAGHPFNAGIREPNEPNVNRKEP